MIEALSNCPLHLISHASCFFEVPLTGSQGSLCAEGRFFECGADGIASKGQAGGADPFFAYATRERNGLVIVRYGPSHVPIKRNRLPEKLKCSRLTTLISLLLKEV